LRVHDGSTPGGFRTVMQHDLGATSNGGFAANIGRNVIAVDSIADLLALPESARREDLRYLVPGYHAGSNVGGGEFYWDASSTANDNGGSVFAVSGVAVGRYLRAQIGEISVKDFGTVGDGVTDDTAAIQAAINAATTAGKNLYAPKGTYKITAQLSV